MTKIKSVLFLIILMTLIACNSEANNQEAEQSIVTSIYPLEYITSEISGDQISVKTVTPPGTDAHTYEPSTKEMIELSNSDAFIYIGSGMESFSETMANTVKNEGVKTIELSNHQQLFTSSSHDEHGHSDSEHGHEEFDPHFWLDPLKMVDAGEIILEELNSIYPEQKTTFESNFKEFKNKMELLDQRYKETLTTQVNLLVTHKSFSYLEERYPIKQFAIRGITSSQEPSQKELNELFNLIEEININHIVLETTSQDQLALTIAEEFNLKVYHLTNLSTRTEQQIQENKNYYDLMLENLKTIEGIQSKEGLNE